jgi:hypothetical protein
MKSFRSCLLILILSSCFGLNSQAADIKLVVASSVVVAGDKLHLGDVIDIGTLPDEWQRRLNALPIAYLLPNSAFDITYAELKSFARRQIPAIASLLPSDDQALVHVSRTTVALERTPKRTVIAEPTTCFRMEQPVDAGTAIAVADVVEPVVFYDHISRVVRAARDLSAGLVIHRFPRTLLSRVHVGDSLQATIQIGHVIASRRVFAIQSSPMGNGIFARTEDGDVIALRQDGKEQ